MKVYGLVPAYNEEDNVQEVIDRLKKIKVVPIVVDDGSTDRTSEFAKKRKAVVLRHEKNKGKGEALKTGFKYILQKCKGAKYVVIIDADMQYPPEESIKLIEVLKQGADLVTGYRDLEKIPFRHRSKKRVFHERYEKHK